MLVISSLKIVENKPRISGKMFSSYERTAMKYFCIRTAMKHFVLICEECTYFINIFLYENIVCDSINTDNFWSAYSRRLSYVSCVFFCQLFTLLFLIISGIYARTMQLHSEILGWMWNRDALPRLAAALSRRGWPTTSASWTRNTAGKLWLFLR